MLIVMRVTATDVEITDVIERVGTLGLKAHVSRGEERTVIGAVGEGTVAYQYPSSVQCYARGRPGRAHFKTL
jgi:3-deoxy-7-phosphoheptulonate synthase